MPRITVTRTDLPPVHVLKFIDHRHRPRKLKRNHIKGATLRVTFQADANSDRVEVEVEEAIHYPAGRTKARQIAFPLIGDEGRALYTLLRDIFAPEEKAR